MVMEAETVAEPLKLALMEWEREGVKEEDREGLTLLQPLAVTEPVELPDTERLTEPQEVGEALELSVEDRVVVMEALREPVTEELPVPQPEGEVLGEADWLPEPQPLLETDLLSVPEAE